MPPPVNKTRGLLLVCLGALIFLGIGATTVEKIQFYTDFPNSVPVGSDFMLFQRNSDYINASVSQVKQDWFNNPVFSGNGGIQGVWTAVTFVGDGSQLTGIQANATNLVVINTITNNTFVNTNTEILTSNAFFNNTYQTNITVEVPGGFTNLNLTPLSAMVTDANDAEAVTPNGPGVYTNNGAGRIGWSTTLSLTELDAQNFYPTNTFLKLTNDVLSTDGNGQITNLSIGTGLSFSGNTLTASGGGPGGPAGGVLGGTYPNPSFGTFTSATLATALSDETGAGLAVFSGSPTLTNITIKGDQFGTNAFFIDKTGITISNNLNQVVVSNGTIYATGKITVSGETNTSSTANTLDVRDGNKNQTSLANGGAYTFLQGTTPPTYTLLSYSTNIVGAANFVFGKAYWTNITGNFTFPALTVNDNAAYESMAVLVTNSGGSTFTATINGVAGAPGHVVPAVFYCTNATVTEIDLSHFGVQWTNACVGKN